MDNLKLQHEIMEELQWEPSIEPAEIGVAVQDGIVTLTGTVSSYAEKLACEKAAKRVQGVLGVAQEIKVRLPDSYARSDAEIAQVAVQALSWNVLVPKGAVMVEVEHGWLTLTGEVTWAFERDAAEGAVRTLFGVCGVTDLIALKPKASPRDVRSEIKRALHRSAEVDAGNIQVETHEGAVTLTGRVHSWLARDEASSAAWAAPGVTTVENHLSVSP